MGADVAGLYDAVGSVASGVLKAAGEDNRRRTLGVSFRGGDGPESRARSDGSWNSADKLDPTGLRGGIQPG